MRRTRFSETQIVKILKEVEGGRTAKEVCGNTVSAVPPTTNGNPNTGAWRPRTSCGSRSSKKKTGV